MQDSKDIEHGDCILNNKSKTAEMLYLLSVLYSINKDFSRMFASLWVEKSDLFSSVAGGKKISIATNESDPQSPNEKPARKDSAGIHLSPLSITGSSYHAAAHTLVTKAVGLPLEHFNCVKLSCKMSTQLQDPLVVTSNCPQMVSQTHARRSVLFPFEPDIYTLKQHQ